MPAAVTPPPGIATDPLGLAVSALRRGGVVLHATEGVWGLACDPLNQQAVSRILQLKGRPGAKGLILIGADATAFAAPLALQTTVLRAAAVESWPGHHTWILPNAGFPDWVTGGRATVACRVPAHAQARALCEAFGGVLVSTSANRTGLPPITSAAAARTEFGTLVDYVLDGEVSGAGRASVIHDLDGALIR